MPSRELQYRVIIDTGSAQSQARAVRNAIESELRQVNVGNIAAPQASASPFSSLAGAANSATTAFSGLNKALGLFGVTLGAVQLTRAAIDLGRLQTEAARAQLSFNVLSGGAAQAQANIQAIQGATGGAVSSLDALKIGNQAAALSLAQTADEFERVTNAGRIVALISPVINDIGSAIAELGLAAANLSFRRLDALGLSVSEVRDRMNNLQAANSSLSDSQAFLEASMAALEAKGGDIVNSNEAQATSYEKLGVAIAEARRAAAGGPIGQALQGAAGFLAGGINELNVLFAGATADSSVIVAALSSITEAYKNQSNILANVPWLGTYLKNDREQVVGQLQEVQQILTLATASLADDPGLLVYQQQIQAIAASVARWNFVTEDQLTALRQLYDELERQKGLNAPGVATQTAAEAAKAAEDARQAGILEQQTSINDALTNRAGKSAGVVNIDDAIAQLKEAKALVDQGIQDLIASGVTDSDELTLRLQQIQEQAISTFDDLEERASNFSFTGIEQSFADIFQGLDISSSDFIPQLQEYRDQAISLFNEIAEAGGVATEEQVAQLDILSSAAQAVSGDNAYLTDIVRDLGDAFLEANPLVGQLVGQLYASEAAYQAGAISADVYNGRMAALGGQLLAYLTQAGAATSATYSLVDAFSALAGTPGFNAGFSGGQAIGNYFQSQENTRVRDEQRKAAEQARREAESAAKRAARESESAAKKAARELEAGAKKARQELENALKGVPGLFGRSPITEKDFRLTKGGVYQDKADEYLRRLQAEVEQGKDIFPQVAIEQAKQSLRDLGVQVAEDNKIAFEQFADAWESGLLFFDPENIAKYINSEAVQRELELQKKAKEGQENILKAFGVAIDDAAEAAQAGIAEASAAYSGGGGAIPYTVPTTAQLIPMPPQATPPTSQYDFGMAMAQWLQRQPAPTQGPQAQPTLGGFAPSIDVEALQQQLTDATLAIHTDVDEESFAATLEKIESTRATLSLRTDVNTESFSATIEKLESTKPTITLYSALDYDSFVAAIGRVSSTKPQLTIGSTLDIESFAALLEKVGSTRQQLEITPTITSDSIATAVSLVSSSNPTITVTPALDYDGFVALVQRIGETRPVMIVDITTVGQGTAGALGGAEGDTSIADSFIANIGQQFATRQNFFYAQGQGPADLVRSGFAASLAGTEEGNATLIDPMLFGLTNSIRANEANFRQRGGTIGLAVISGLQQQLTSEQVSTSITAIGESIGGYLLVGILNKFNGIADAIGAQILNDLTNTVEEPAP